MWRRRGLWWGYGGGHGGYGGFMVAYEAGRGGGYGMKYTVALLLVAAMMACVLAGGSGGGYGGGRGGPWRGYGGGYGGGHGGGYGGGYGGGHGGGYGGGHGGLWRRLWWGPTEAMEAVMVAATEAVVGAMVVTAERSLVDIKLELPLPEPSGLTSKGKALYNKYHCRKFCWWRHGGIFNGGSLWGGLRWRLTEAAEVGVWVLAAVAEAMVGARGGFWWRYEA
ncbi:chorion class A protein L11-like [Penaeus monodon]|uniref:chorion class A protein L11-like n=1 Tax=Penaeus monodon TaxID=6687 RepID=UPI0018A6F160|nr:chorion class A protein L11-like [Penaeus monodon]